MLQILREKAKGIVAWFVVVAILASFAFFGVADYFQIGNSRVAARVNGEKISWTTVEAVSHRLSQQYGTQLDKKTLTQQVVSVLAQRVALLQAAKALGFRVGPEQAEKLLLKIPAFQDKGQFSKEQYLKALEAASYTDVDFRKQLQQDILVGQWEHGLLLSGFVLPNEFQQAGALFEQKRDFRYLLITAAQQEKSIEVNPEQISAYYEEHKAKFVQPEQVALEYIALSLGEIMQTIKPSEESVLAYYREHQSAYSAPTRVHARHILVAASKDNIEQDKKAKQKIEELLSKLKTGADFAKLAQEFSDDKVSAEKGGDLGWFMQGQMVAEFDQAVFALKKSNVLSDPVRTQFGYHIIQLLERKESEIRSFEEVKDLVLDQLKREKAQVQFAETAERISKLAFEQSDALQPIAEKYGMKLKVTLPFGREGGQGIAATPEVTTAAFSPRVLKEKHNSEPLKLSDSSLVIVRLKEYFPATQKTLEQVNMEIRKILVSERARTEVKAIAEKALDDIQKGSKPEDIAKQLQLSWITKTDVPRTSVEGLDPSITTLAFQVSSHDEDHIKAFRLPNHDYLIVDLIKVKLGDWSNLDRNIRTHYAKSLSDFSSHFEYALYVNQVQSAAKISTSQELASQ